MINELLKDTTFAELLEIHAAGMIGYLLDREVEFGILCNLSGVHFDPPLPESITKSFKPLTLFMLAGYTFESAELDEHSLRFEAGFGPDNIGSHVYVPLESIIQVIVEETVVFVNLTASIQKPRKAPTPPEHAGSMERSIQSLLANPDNEKFLKKKE